MNKETSNTGLSLAGVLTLIFVVLKLVGIINWSWWWVLSPVLIETCISLLILAGFCIYGIYENKK